MDVNEHIPKEQPKKAYLVEVTIITRVVADKTIDKDTDDGFSKLGEMAIKKIKDDVNGYLCLNNVDEIYEDIDCPYSPETDEK